MAPLAHTHPVTEELMKRDRIAAVVALLRRATVDDDFDRVAFIDEVLDKIPAITDAEIDAGFKAFRAELQSIRRPALFRTIAWRTLGAVLFVGSAALVAAIIMGAL